MTKWIIAGAAAFAAGAVLCTASMAAMSFDLRKLNTSELEENTYNVTDSFTDISIAASTEDISFASSNDGRCRVVCIEESDQPHDVRVENGTLTISRRNTSKIHLGFNFYSEAPSVTVYLPEKDFGRLTVDTDTGDVSIPQSFTFESLDAELDTGDISCFADIKGMADINTDTGNITVKDISAKEMKLASHTGDIKLYDLAVNETLNITENTGDVKMNDVTCADLTSDGDTGDLDMTKVIASGKFSLRRSTGDVKFSGCDAEEIFITTDTGDVDGTLLSDKVVIAATDTGNLDVPKTISGGRCEITTNTGDVSIRIQ